MAKVPMKFQYKFKSLEDRDRLDFLLRVNTIDYDDEGSDLWNKIQAIQRNLCEYQRVSPIFYKKNENWEEIWVIFGMYISPTKSNIFYTETDLKSQLWKTSLHLLDKIFDFRPLDHIYEQMHTTRSVPELQKDR